MFARGNLGPTSLGRLVDLMSNVAIGEAKERSADVLRHGFEYFLGEFPLSEGKKSGQFYTPRSVVPDYWLRGCSRTKAEPLTLAMAQVGSSSNPRNLWNNEGSFLNDAHKDLKVDYVSVISPFKDSDWIVDLLRIDEVLAVRCAAKRQL